MSICCRICTGWFSVPTTDDNVDNKVEEKTQVVLKLEEIEIVTSIRHQNQNNVLVNLPKYMFLNFLKDWVTISELVVLDSSMSDEKLRSLFLSFIASPDVIFYGHVPSNDGTNTMIPFAYVSWLLIRQINVLELDFSGNYQKHSKLQITQHSQQQKLHKVKILRFNITSVSTMEQLVQTILVCPNLDELYLSEFISADGNDESKITDIILAHGKNLTVLELKQASMSNRNSSLCAILNHCGHLHTLVYAGRANKALQRVDVPDVAQMTAQHTALTSLDLSNNHMVTDDLVFSILLHCAALQSLNLTECIRLTDVSMSHIAQHCTQLTTLSIRNSTKITDEGVSYFAYNCSSLTSLDISDCSRLTDAALLSLSDHSSQLMRLYANRTGHISNAGLDAIAKRCHSLEVLHIVVSSSNGVTSGVLSRFGQCERLSELAFNLGTRLPIESGIVGLTKRCARLKSVDISRNELTTDTAVSAFGLYCPLLEGLSIFGEMLTDRSIVSLAEGCPLLTLLHVREAVLLTDISVLVLSRRCPGLRKLKLDGCQRLTDAALIALANDCKQLSVLCAGGCFELTDVGVSLLVVNCSKLSELNVQYANKLTSNCVRMLKGRKHIRSLKVPFK